MYIAARNFTLDEIEYLSGQEVKEVNDVMLENNLVIENEEIEEIEEPKEHIKEELLIEDSSDVEIETEEL